jgi:hypothetical protein
MPPGPPVELRDAQGGFLFFALRHKKGPETLECLGRAARPFSFLPEGKKKKTDGIKKGHKNKKAEDTQAMFAAFLF